jgi:hypothetical protein
MNSTCICEFCETQFKDISIEEHYNTSTVCLRLKQTKENTRKETVKQFYQEYIKLYKDNQICSVDLYNWVENELEETKNEVDNYKKQILKYKSQIQVYKQIIDKYMNNKTNII